MPQLNQIKFNLSPDKKSFELSVSEEDECDGQQSFRELQDKRPRSEVPSEKSTADFGKGKEDPKVRGSE